MRKIYQAPHTTCVTLYVQKMLALSGNFNDEETIEDPDDFGARRSIKSRDAWEMW